MDWGKYDWHVLELVRFVLIGCPAVITLWKYKRRGHYLPFLYYGSWINLFVYLSWLLLINAVTCFLSIASGSQSARWLASSGLEGDILIFIPLLCFLGSIILFVLSLLSGVIFDKSPAPKDTEWRYAALVNLLMVVFWIASAVAPN